MMHVRLHFQSGSLHHPFTNSASLCSIVHHTSVNTSVFFMEFSDYLESLLLSKEPLLISGDFNIHVDSTDDADALKLQDLLESVGLRQYVSQGH